MRTGYNNSILIVTGKSSKRKGCIRGLNLGSDYVAEHEWGIKGIKDAFGITPDGIGVEGKKIRKLPEEYMFLEGKFSGLFFGRLYAKTFGKDTIQEHMDNLRPTKAGLWTAWDERSFAAGTCDGTLHDELKTIHQAFVAHDIAIWLGGG